MELAPIAGIRAVALFENRRVERDLPQRFEIDASAAADDGANPEAGQTPEEGSEERQERFDQSDEQTMEATSDTDSGEVGINVLA